jgi:predicted AlkP superfamily pyrophosphatase or phosphodiesterase
MRAGSEPVLPAYGGACIASLAPALLQIVSQSGNPVPGNPVPDWPVPDWLPKPVRHASQVVLLVVDGLGWAQLQSNREVTPTFSAGIGGPITSVAPTTTATALTSISTGLTPAEHGLVGYRLAVGADRESPTDARARILNVLKWRTEDGDARVGLPPREFQPIPAFGGAPVTTVTRGDFLATGFSAAHLNGPNMVGWQVPSTIVVETRRRLSKGERFVHAYYDGPDKVAHEHGLGKHYGAELLATDRLVGDLLGALPPGACLVVTSDHGQVDVGRSAELPANELLEASWLISGEGRFRWFHARSGAELDLLAAAVACHGDVAWVRTLEQVIDEGWFGGPLDPGFASRLGDVALVAREPVAFLDPADTGETRLAARHGSLTAAEMYVPLLAFGPG